MALYRKRTKSSASEDEEIIRMYWRRDENAIRETDLKYGGYLFAVAYRIVRDRRDCEECLNDTYVGVWEAVPPAWPNALKAFLTTIMRRVAINRYHAGLRKKRIPSEMTVVLSELEDVLAGRRGRRRGSGRRTGSAGHQRLYTHAFPTPEFIF